MEVGYLRLAAALVAVIALLVAAGWLARRSDALRRMTGQSAEARLALVESRWLDGKHRVVLLRWDQREQVVLIGPAAMTPLFPNPPAARSDDP